MIILKGPLMIFALNITAIAYRHFGLKVASHLANGDLLDELI